MSGRAPTEIFQHIRAPFAELPELGSMGRRESKRAGRWCVHRHPSAEIHFVERGLVSIQIGSGVELVRSGQCVVTRPDEPHGGPTGLIGPCRMQWICLRLPRAGRSWFGLSEAETTELIDSLHMRAARTLTAPKLRSAFAELRSAHTSGHRNAALLARSALLRILIAAAYEQPVAGHSVIVSEAMRWMESHVDTAFESATIAKHLGWSRSRLLAVFREEVGMPASDWHLELRVLEACRRLADPALRITSIAHALGFATSQYFATAFRRITGVSPEVYRRVSERQASGAELAKWIDLSEPLLRPSQLSA